MEIEDDSGKCVKAMTVFGMTIKYMKEHLLKTVKARQELIISYKFVKGFLAIAFLSIVISS